MRKYIIHSSLDPSPLYFNVQLSILMNSLEMLLFLVFIQHFWLVFEYFYSLFYKFVVHAVYNLMNNSARLFLFLKI